MLHAPQAHLHDRIELLEEENRQLKDRIAELLGKDERAAARRAFGFNTVEAGLFLFLLRRGCGTYDQLCDAVYSDRHRAMLAEPECAIRSNIKRARRKLRPHGIDFTTVYGFGYHFNDPDRSVARRKLQEAT